MLVWCEFHSVITYHKFFGRKTAWRVSQHRMWATPHVQSMWSCPCRATSNGGYLGILHRSPFGSHSNNYYSTITINIVCKVIESTLSTIKCARQWKVHNPVEDTRWNKRIHLLKFTSILGTRFTGDCNSCRLPTGLWAHYLQPDVSVVY